MSPVNESCRIGVGADVMSHWCGRYYRHLTCLMLYVRVSHWCGCPVGADVIGRQPILPREPRASGSQGAEKEAGLL